VAVIAALAWSVATHGSGFRVFEPSAPLTDLPLIAAGCDRLALSEEGPRVKSSPA
jgi:hypothetical protein